MFCRKCGNKIPNDSLFCLICGTKVEAVEQDSHILQGQPPVEGASKIPEHTAFAQEGANISRNESTSSAETGTTKSRDGNKNTKTAGILVAVALIIIICIIAWNSGKCVFSNCGNRKAEGSDYCYQHTCSAEGCTFVKSEYDSYCYTHEQEYICVADNCDSKKMSGSEYCSVHTCKKSGCTKKVNLDTAYCQEHQINMRNMLINSGFIFSLNSAGGIVFSFSATNATGNEIKYVKFDVELRNAVGDRVKDEIIGTTSVHVEIIGPVIQYGEVLMSQEIIGYCDTCARLDIDDITIVYTDGSSDTGHFGFYANKQ